MDLNVPDYVFLTLPAVLAVRLCLTWRERNIQERRRGGKFVHLLLKDATKVVKTNNSIIRIVNFYYSSNNLM